MTQRGLTLVELLVTLVLMSLVGGVVAQMMGQSRRVEALLEQQSTATRLEGLHEIWLRETVEGALPSALGAPPDFVGHEQGFSVTTTMPPLAESQGPQRVRIELAGTELQVKAERTQALTTLRLDLGRKAAFEYLDDAGQWRPQWPPLDVGALRTVPVAVRLLREGRTPLLMLPRASALGLPNRAQLLQ